MKGYVYVDFAGPRIAAAEAIKGKLFLKVSRRPGPNGDLMIGAIVASDDQRQAVEKELLSLGEWDREHIAFNSHSYDKRKTG